MIFLFPEKYKLERNGDRFTFELGGYYYCENDKKTYQFIKTSPKGFNFVDTKNGRCHFTRAVIATHDVSHKHFITLSVNAKFTCYTIEFFGRLKALEKRTWLTDALQHESK
jgi:hypothetical protein